MRRSWFRSSSASRNASITGGKQWPRISGPRTRRNRCTRCRRRRKMWDPSPRAMNGGVPPTPRKARTGEFTPPGISFWALGNAASDRDAVHIGSRPDLIAGDQPFDETLMTLPGECHLNFLKAGFSNSRYGCVPANRSPDEQAEPGAASNEIHRAGRNRAEEESPRRNALASVAPNSRSAAKSRTTGCVSLRLFGQRKRFVQQIGSLIPPTASHSKALRR